MEASMLASCDAAVYVSHTLMEEESDLVCKGTSVFLDHGVDVVRFTAGRNAPEPTDVIDIPRPRVGFFGGIDDYVVDLDLIKQLAEKNPDIQIVLIGAATCSIDELTAFENVHWLGMRPYDEIPALGASFDVAIMPWLDSEWIQRCNPIKAKEYLALGLPVVTTQYPEARYMADVLEIAENPQEFLELVRDVITTGGSTTPEERISRVREDSWQSRADIVDSLFSAAKQN